MKKVFKCAEDLKLLLKSKLRNYIKKKQDQFSSNVAKVS